MNVVQFPKQEQPDIANELVGIADQIKSGQFGVVAGAFLILETDENHETFPFGDVGDCVRLVGLLETAKTIVMSDE